ncbi:MAG: amino acid ABC transporter substrate-binding protein [Paraglaciecola sp.]|nr:amino acid ABC transporter substrate-binding protein [Paraglaciecola sp.]
MMMCISMVGAANESRSILRYNLDKEGGWVPFDSTDDPERPGVFIELIPLLMEYAEIDAVEYNLPTKRGVVALFKGNLDFDFVNPQWVSEEEAKDFVFSIAILPVTENFIALAENQHMAQDTQQIYGKLVGTVAGYYYYDDDLFKRADFRSESEVMLGLAHKRFDVAIMEQTAARYWSKIHQVPIALGAVHTQGDIVLRLRAEKKFLLPRINHAIEMLHQQNTINEILEHYVGTVQGN